MTHTAWNDIETAAGIAGYPDVRRAHGRNHSKAHWAWRALERAFAGAVLLVYLFAHWRERARQRKTLAQLDDRLLRDIGLSRYDAQWESKKPFWQ